MPRAVNDDVSLHYSVDGPSDAPTVVLLEGLGYGRWMWRWLTDAIHEEYEVIRPDNRGTGKSDTPEGPYTIGEMADDVEAVLDHHGADAAAVVGASMGGMIGMQYALEYDRAEALGLLCTSPGGEEAVPTPEDVLDHIFSTPDEYNRREALKYRMEPAASEGFYEAEPDLVERILDWRLAGDAADAGRNAQAAAVEAFDVSDRLDELSLPTLVMHGTADRVLPVENGDLLADRLPNAEYERVDGGSHLFFIEKRERVNERVREFLEAHV
ncbi:alpha/beta fold hydrolase [Haloparvum sp. PAK95]|uniref:alpha/beta fold hydrolase n=1 Tax=Haloparvum sp. PAK95 TaxID=3418962 RepID=UPI003D2EFB51